MSGVLTTLAGAAPVWVIAAVTLFALALVASAAAWTIGLRACGGKAPFHQVASRYAVGSLVNAVAPAHLGSAVRIGLLARTLPGRDRLLRVGGVEVALAAARLVALALLVVAAAAIGRLPAWPAPVLGVVGVTAFVVARRGGGRVHGRLRSAVEVFGSLGACARAWSWIAASFAGRLAAACAVAAAFGVSRPLSAGILLLWAIAVAGVVPVTPGNFGVGAGAAGVALHTIGIDVHTALAVGLAFQAAETLAGVTLGIAGAAVVSTPGTRARRLALVGAAAAMLAALLVGVVAVDLV
jgi:uncharacterized membrane protein YbhN (UPF0104 family)